MRHLSAGRPASHYHTLARSAPARVPPATARADGVGASTVYVVDDDAEQRAAIEFLLASVKCSVQAFDSASAFLDAGIEPAGVMILDMRMPGLSGLGLQQRLAWSPLIEIIFLSGVAEVPDSVAAMKAGAADFLVKPVRPQVLLDVVASAMERIASRQSQARRGDIHRASYDQLTEAEREIAALVVDGLRNKQIAFATNRTENTVKVHRARIMQKMGATSVVDLIARLSAVDAVRGSHATR
jgi:FixJ family two-component response regulator